MTWHDMMCCCDLTKLEDPFSVVSQRHQRCTRSALRALVLDTVAYFQDLVQAYKLKCWVFAFWATGSQIEIDPAPHKRCSEAQLIWSICCWPLCLRRFLSALGPLDSWKLWDPQSPEVTLCFYCSHPAVSDFNPGVVFPNTNLGTLFEER